MRIAAEDGRLQLHNQWGVLAVETLKIKCKNDHIEFSK